MCDWLKKLLLRWSSYDTYLRVVKRLEPIEEKLYLLRYFLFTRTKEGNSLQDTVFPRLNSIFGSAIFKSCSYSTILIITLIAPSFLPEFLRNVIDMKYDVTVISGFIAAVLTIAGVFLSLFYTNVTTVFSNKYPSSSGDIPKLFVSMVSSDKNLEFCTSFVIVFSLSFIACVTEQFNWIAFIYLFALSMLLIGKLPSIFALGTGKTDITAISIIPANRFLALAKASSFDKAFFESEFLLLNFNRLALNSLDLIDIIMNYSLIAGDYTPSYTKAVSEIALKTLIKYSQISTVIDIESDWYDRKYSQKPWFMSSSAELSIAISTGTIPQPEKNIDRLCYQRELYEIINKYGRYLIENSKGVDYIEYFSKSTYALESCIKHGDIEWAKEYSDVMLRQCLDFCITLSSEKKESLQLKCQLLEYYAVMLISIPLELFKLCQKVTTDAFHFNSFSSFSQEELQRQGFPLGNNVKMKAMCKKLKYEYDTFDKLETPRWWFDKNVNSIALETIEQLNSWVLLLHCQLCSSIERFLILDPKLSYILVLKEAEFFKKSKYYIEGILKFAKSHFEITVFSKDYIKELEDKHNNLVRTYPDLISSLSGTKEKIEEFFPDLYGFSFFNYAQLLFEDIVNDRLNSFCNSVISFYQLVIISSIELQEKLSNGIKNDIYKIQILLEPTTIFLELCGMAYVMAEVNKENCFQIKLSSCISSIIRENSEERKRLITCVDLSNDYAINGKINMDLSSWRIQFLDKLKETENYPYKDYYSFNVMDPELSVENVRLKKMIPHYYNDFGSFNGCKVFKDFLLEDDNHD